MIKPFAPRSAARHPLLLCWVLAILATLPIRSGTAHADARSPLAGRDILDTATIEVTVTASGQPLPGALVSLDLNDNGVWEPELDEPRHTTDGSGGVLFDAIVSIGDLDPGHGGSAEATTWSPTRIMTGNLSGTIGAREVRVDFVLPDGAHTAGLALFDVRGRRLAQTGGPGDLSLSLPDDLPTGVYFMRLSADRAAPVAHRFTSAGPRTRTITARRVSAAEALAAGWAGLDPQRPRKSLPASDDAHRVNLIVEHASYDAVIQAEALQSGLNVFTVAMPDVPTAGLQLWLDAADPATLDVDAEGYVATWQDKSGHGRHAAAVAADGSDDRKARATVSLDRQVVLFESSRRSALLIDDFRPVGNFTVFSVVHSSHSANNQSYWWGGASASEGAAFTLLAGGNRYVFSTYNRALYSTDGIKSSVAPQLVVLTRGSEPVNNTVSFRFDGQADTQNTVVGGASNSNFYLGCRGGSWNTEFPLNGFIAEHLHYDRTLTPEEIAAVEQHLLAKWALGGD